MHNISLPDPIRAAAEQLAALAGFKTTDDYIADLIRRDLEQVQQEPYRHLRQAMAKESSSGSVTDEELEQGKREIEALLLEGLNSGPATPMTSADWNNLRQRVEGRLSKRNAQ